MRNWMALVAGIVVITLSGCAQSPESIQPAYVSSIPYDGWTCTQLAEEGAHLDSALATASAQQSQARSNDIAAVILVGLPLASMSGGNIAPQIALYKGQQEAVRLASTRKSCTGPVG